MLITRIRSVSAIQFTQEQVRTLTGASVETVRHWRKAVPYLAEKSGKAARFSFSDVVALAITHELVRTFGVQIASVGIGIDSLFRLLSQTNHQSLDGGAVFITQGDAALCDVTQPIRHSIETPGWIIPLRPVIARIQGAVVPAIGSDDSQTALPFPPGIIRSSP